jgi:hypothetical protein
MHSLFSLSITVLIDKKPNEKAAAAVLKLFWKPISKTKVSVSR